MIFANFTGYMRLKSKTNCPIKLLCFLDYQGSIRETQSGLNALLSEGVHQSLRNWKAHCAPEAMDANMKKRYDQCLSRQLGEVDSMVLCTQDFSFKDV